MPVRSMPNLIHAQSDRVGVGDLGFGMQLSEVIAANLRHIIHRSGVTQRAWAMAAGTSEANVSRWLKRAGMHHLDGIGRAVGRTGASPLALLQLPNSPEIDPDAAEFAARYIRADEQTRATVRHILRLAELSAAQPKAG